MPKHHLDDLIQLMAELRSPQHGCPWDLKQSYQTILPHTLEEVYEVADAIDREQMNELRLELGDLLFQIVFYAQLAKEDKVFDFYDIVDGVTDKLLRRHPHVFPAGTLESAGTGDGAISEQQIRENWRKIKAQERREQAGEQQRESQTDTVPKAMPALLRAFKLQQVASSVGFDWPDIDGVWEKLKEELAELRSAVASGDNEQIQEELGDLFFTCVNLARHLQVPPESALRTANRKFESRFRAVERAVADQNLEMSSMTPEQLEFEWEQAKKQLAE